MILFYSLKSKTFAESLVVKKDFDGNNAEETRFEFIDQDDNGVITAEEIESYEKFQTDYQRHSQTLEDHFGEETFTYEDAKNEHENIIHNYGSSNLSPEQQERKEALEFFLNIDEHGNRLDGASPMAFTDTNGDTADAEAVSPAELDAAQEIHNPEKNMVTVEDTSPFTGDYPSEPATEPHIVKEGETLTGIVEENIADEDWTDEEVYQEALRIAEQNGIENPDLIYPDDEIDIRSEVEVSYENALGAEDAADTGSNHEAGSASQTKDEFINSITGEEGLVTHYSDNTFSLNVEESDLTKEQVEMIEYFMEITGATLHDSDVSEAI